MANINKKYYSNIFKKNFKKYPTSKKKKKPAVFYDMCLNYCLWHGPLSLTIEIYFWWNLCAFTKCTHFIKGA